MIAQPQARPIYCTEAQAEVAGHPARHQSGMSGATARKGYRLRYFFIAFPIRQCALPAA
jgi:hypothetical protein